MKSKLIIICTLLIILCSISAVSAQDINDTQMTYVNDVNDVNDINDVNDVNDVNDINDVNDVNDVNDINDVNDVNDVIDVSTTQAVLSDDDGASLTNDKEIDNVLSEDSSPGSFSDLQTTINDAQEGSTISLDKDYKSTQRYDIILDKSLTIDGQGHTLDCDDYCRAFASKSGHITLKNLIIKNGNNVLGSGGAIYITGSSSYTIINCTFTDNHARDGGAIYNNVEHYSLTITDSKFDSNNGAAIYSKGAVYVENSEFTSNTGEDGGAIYCQNSVYLSSSRFSANNATGAIILSDEGGAIYAKGQIFAENCNFTENSANRGGAIHGHNFVFISNCTFTGNKAKVGGAIHKTSDGYVAISNSTFIENEATSDHGGAIYTNGQINIDNSVFRNNTANGKGGAIYSEYIQFEGNSTFFQNHAKGHGGAIYTNLIEKNVNDLYFDSNYAESDYGGAIYINKKCGDVNFNNVTFLKNYAYAGDGGAIYSDSGSTNLNLYNCVFKENYADGGTSKRYGGAVRSCGNVNVYGSTFISNWAENHGGAIYASTVNHVENGVFISNNVKKGDGGAIYINNKGTSSISKTYFKGNTAKDRGGAIYTDSTSLNLNLNNNAFVSNSAEGQGKAVFNSGNYNIDGNWWGTNSPSFNNQELMEYHTWGSNEAHSDDGYNTVSVSGDGSTYNNVAATIKITFKKDVPKYLLENIEISSDKAHILDKKVNGKTLELSYIPTENGTHNISITIDSQTLKHELRSEFISVYGYDLVRTDGDSNTYSATFRDMDGNFLNPGEQVLFTVDGNNYTHTVSEEGIATFNEVLRLQPGTYNVTAHNLKTAQNFTNQITIQPRTSTYNMSDYFVIQFLNNTDSISYENENITFHIANKTFVSNVTNGTACFRLDVPAGDYTLDIYHESQLIKSISNIKVLNQYSNLLLSPEGENYAALTPISVSEKFMADGEAIYSEIGENMRRYVFSDGYGAIIYNVTVSNSEEFTNVLRKISNKDFHADVIILNLKPGTYKISDSFYEDQDHKYLIHLTTGNLFINGNGAVIEDGYQHNFMAMESGTSASIENLTFKTFYRVFVNNGNLYCANCSFIKNDGWTLLTDTRGSVVYNRNQATFRNCTFDNNTNDVRTYAYNPNLQASIYAETNSLTNLVQCKFTENDTVHAVDGSMVVIYDTSDAVYDLFTNDTRNTFEFGSCLDNRPLESYNKNKTLEYYCYNEYWLSHDFYQTLQNRDVSNLIFNLKKDVYMINLDEYEQYSSHHDFRTFNREHDLLTPTGTNDDPFAYHEFLFDVGSRPVVINGNGATIWLNGTNESDDRHFAFVPRYGSLTLVNLTICGFNSAIINYGQLILINCTFNYNKIHYSRTATLEAEKGGAIRNYGSVYCYNTTFINNHATEGAAYYSSGSSAYGQFYNCTFKDNSLISILDWKHRDANDFFVDEGSIVKIAQCTGIRESTIKTGENALVLYRDTIDVTFLNYTVDSIYSLMKLSNLVKNNHDYDIINVSFVKGDYGVLSNSKIFDMDYGQLMLSGNGARIFVKSPKDNDETQFLVTTSRSSVIITGLTIEGFNIAIENKGALNIVNSSFINNRVDYMKKNDYGGAIVNDKGASLTVYNVTFNDNYAKYGGAIYNLGNAIIIECNFSDNKGYNDKNANVDIYNHNASVSIITVGDSPNVSNHFPMAAWKQKVITAAIMTGVTIASAGAGFGISTALASAAQLVSLAVGAGIGAIGGTVDAVIYSTDNQDYSQFASRVKDGVVMGITAASFGAAVRNAINANRAAIEMENNLKLKLAELEILGDFDPYPKYEEFDTTFI